MDKQKELQRAIAAQKTAREKWGIDNNKPHRIDHPEIPTPPAEMPLPTPASVVFSGDRSRWDAFDWQRHPSLAKAKKVIVDWYNDLPGSGALVLAGNNGSGKTHIARALCDLFGGWRTSFYGEVALAKAIQQTYDNRSVSEDGFIKQAIFRPEVFILDDLGTYQAKDMSWMSNVYNRLFDEFLTSMGKPLLVTTNLPLVGPGRSIETRIGNRSFSRLCGAMRTQSAYVNLFDVSDYRIERFLGDG